MYDWNTLNKQNEEYIRSNKDKDDVKEVKLDDFSKTLDREDYTDNNHLKKNVHKRAIEVKDKL